MSDKLVFILSLLVLIMLSLTGCERDGLEVTNNTKYDEVTKKPIYEDVKVEEPVKETYAIDPIIDMRGADLDSYNGEVLSGTQAYEVLKQYKNSNVAFLVATQMVMDGTEDINKLDGNVDAETPTAGAKGVQGALNTAGDSLTDILTFVNYGAVLKQGKDGVVLEFKDTYFLLDQDFDQALEKVEVNQNILRADRAGYAENMAEYLHFQTYLIKDKTGKAIGLALYTIPSR